MVLSNPVRSIAKIERLLIALLCNKRTTRGMPARFGRGKQRISRDGDKKKEHAPKRAER